MTGRARARARGRARGQEAVQCVGAAAVSAFPCPNCGGVLDTVFLILHQLALAKRRLRTVSCEGIRAEPGS